MERRFRHPLSSILYPPSSILHPRFSLCLCASVAEDKIVVRLTALNAHSMMKSL